MPRGYRCIVFAAVGWLIVAAGPPPKGYDGSSEQQKTERQIAESLNSIDATLKKPAKPDVTTQPCEDGKERRDSDLCAQWKAADAAAWSTIAGWVFGVVGSLVGGATLLAAIQAAKWAKRAAEETERSAIAAEAALGHAREVTGSELRPYLFVDKIELVKPSDEEELYSIYRVAFWLKNFGHTPARDIEVSSLVFVTTDLVMLESIDDTDDRFQGGVAAPGHTRRTFDAFYFGEGEWNAFAHNQAFVVARIRYWYRDDGGTGYEEAVDYYMDSTSFNEDFFFYLLTPERRLQWAKMQESLFPDLDEPEPKPKRRRKPKAVTKRTANDDTRQREE